MPKAVRRAVFAGLLLIVGLAVFQITRLPNAPSAPAPEFQPRVTPDAKGQVPRQGQIVIDLPAGFTGTLTVNQEAVPPEQLNKAQNQQAASSQQLTFQPGPGKAIEYFVGGPNCATFVYWRVDTPDQKFTKAWCFTAV